MCHVLYTLEESLGLVIYQHVICTSHPYDPLEGTVLPTQSSVGITEAHYPSSSILHPLFPLPFFPGIFVDVLESSDNMLDNGENLSTL